MTVAKLKEFIDEQIEQGNGEKEVLISTDEEGNGFHALYYGFTTDKSAIDMIYEWGLFVDNCNPENVVLLG